MNVIGEVDGTARKHIDNQLQSSVCGVCAFACTSKRVHIFVWCVVCVRLGVLRREFTYLCVCACVCVYI